MGDFGIKINNQFLDLYPNTGFSYVLNSPFYLGGELGDAIAGSLIFSVKVPLTATNNALLRFPGLIDNAWSWVEKQPCSVYAESICVWCGQLDIVAPSSEREANIRITINSAAALQTLKMNELDLGTMNFVQDVNSIQWADQTALNPDAHNFLFPTVWNPTFWGSTDYDFRDSAVQNLWIFANRNDPSGFGGTNPPPQTPAFTPMPKLSFVLEKMMQAIGMSLNNNFQITHELSRLILYANASLNAQTALFSTATAYPLSRGLSSTTAAVFLRHLCRKFAIGLFINQETATAELLPFKQAYETNTVIDLTKKQLYGYELSQNIEYPNVLADKLTDTIISGNLKDLPKFESFDGFSGIEGVYNLEGETLYYKNLKNPDVNSPNHREMAQLSRARLSNTANLQNPKGTSRYENEIGTLILSRFDNQNLVEFPSIAQRGKDGSEALTSDNNTADRLLFYRGFSRTEQPFASCETQYLRGEKIKVNTGNFTPYDAQNSLDWNGQTGIYNRHWREIHQVVANGKHIKTRILFSIADLKNFSFEQKVRLGNQEGFVKSISGVLNRQGLQPADVSIVTIT